MNWEEFIRILTLVLDKEQLYAVLEGVTDGITEGYCPLCGEEEKPVDKHGKVIEGDDVSMAFEWREQHADECPVHLIEQSTTYQEQS